MAIVKSKCKRLGSLGVNLHNAVIKRPVLITIVAVIFLGIAVIPVKNMDLSIPQIDSLPESYDSRQAFELVENTFDLAMNLHFM